MLGRFPDVGEGSESGKGFTTGGRVWEKGFGARKPAQKGFTGRSSQAQSGHNRRDSRPRFTRGLTPRRGAWTLPKPPGGARKARGTGGMSFVLGVVVAGRGRAVVADGRRASRARARFREVVLHGAKDVENEFRVSELYLGVRGAT